MSDAMMPRWKAAAAATLALFGAASSPPPVSSAEMKAAATKAQLYADRFYKIRGCSAGMGFRYAVRDDGATFLVRVTPPPRLHGILNITIDRKRMRITGVQRIS
jgi:hypothetical protein